MGIPDCKKAILTIVFVAVFFATAMGSAILVFSKAIVDQCLKEDHDPKGSPGLPDDSFYRVGEPVREIHAAELDCYNDGMLKAFKKYPKTQTVSLWYLPNVTEVGLSNLKYLSDLRDLSIGGARFNGASLTFLSNLRKIERLELGFEVSDKELNYLKDLVKLQDLSLQGPITSKGLRYLQDLPELKSMRLACGDLDNNECAVFKRFSRLELLSLQFSSVGNSGLVHLGNMKNLKELVPPPALNDEGMKFLKRIPNLEKIWLGDTKITDDGLVHLIDMEKLRWVCLNGANISDVGIKHLVKIKHLELLDVAGTRITDVSAPLLSNCRELRSLKLNGTEITDASLTTLVRLNNLESLSLRACSRITDLGMVNINKMSKLKELDLFGTNIGDTGIVGLHRLVDLKHVNLELTLVTDDGNRALQVASPKLKIKYAKRR